MVMSQLHVKIKQQQQLTIINVTSDSVIKYSKPVHDLTIICIIYFYDFVMAVTMISVQSCGWLSPPNHGQKEGTLYLERATVKFSCNNGYRLYGSQERTCQGDGMWSGKDAHCVAGK